MLCDESWESVPINGEQEDNKTNVINTPSVFLDYALFLILGYSHAREFR